MNILPATIADWPEIEQIYRQGIRTGQATFQTEAEVPSDEYWFSTRVPNQTFKGVNAAGAIVAWTCLSPVSSRPVYRGVAEVSVYVSDSAKGQGVGSKMLANLISKSEAAGIWTLQSSIFPENEASVHIHKKQGFRIVGTREKIAQQDGIWRDTLFMERRSSIIW